MINNQNNTNTWDSTLEDCFRIHFLADISKNISDEQACPLTEIFLEIFDNCSHNEADFINAVSLYVDSPEVTGDMYQMSKNALEYYDTYKQHLASNIAREKMFKERQEAFNLPEEIVINHVEEKNDPLAFNEEQRDIIDRIIEESTCPIEMEFLTDAVTLSCGHSMNLTYAVKIHSNLNKAGKCEKVSPCSNCRAEVISYESNIYLRKVASKIEEFVNSLDDINSSFETQRGLIHQLNEFLICSKSKRPLTEAVLYKKMTLNEGSFTDKSTPDYVLRQLTRLVGKLNDSLNS
jgi:hypothetical protein